MSRFIEVSLCFRYDGTISHKADIAKVIVKGHFEYQPHIAPACLKFAMTKEYPKNGTYALVAGWGRTKVSDCKIPCKILSNFSFL